MCVKYYASEWNKHIDGTYKSPWWKIEKMLGMMKRHPLMCYAEFCGEYTWYYNGSFLAEFIKYESKDKISKIRESINTAFWLPYTKLKIFLSQKSNVIPSNYMTLRRKTPDGERTINIKLESRFRRMQLMSKCVNG